jgi:transaldolase
MFTRRIDQMPPPEVVREIDDKVDMAALERELMAEGIQKFVEPQRALLGLVARKRAESRRRVSAVAGRAGPATGGTNH